MSCMYRVLLARAAVAVPLALAGAAPAWAGAFTIDDLFNTGVDASGVVLPGGSDDPHYLMTDAPSIATNVPGKVALSGFFPLTPGLWIANDGDSAWIGPQADPQLPSENAVGLPGNYIFRTTFTLPVDVDLATVSITGSWGVDNAAPDPIRLNGNSTGITLDFSVTNPFQVLHDFSITSGFVAGTNTLDFIVLNGGLGANPVGLRVDDLVGMYDVVASDDGPVDDEPSTDVPAPGGLALLLIGLTGLAWRRR